MAGKHKISKRKIILTVLVCLITVLIIGASVMVARGEMYIYAPASGTTFFGITIAGDTDNENPHKLIKFNKVDGRSRTYYEITGGNNYVTASSDNANGTGSDMSNASCYYIKSRLMLGTVFQVNGGQTYTSLFVKEDEGTPEKIFMAVNQYVSNDKSDTDIAKNLKLAHAGYWRNSYTTQTTRDDTSYITVRFRYDNGDPSSGAGQDTRIGWNGANKEAGKLYVDLADYKYRYIIFNPFTYKIKADKGFTDTDKKTVPLSRWGLENVYDQIVDRENKVGADFIGWSIKNQSGAYLFGTSATTGKKASDIKKYLDGSCFKKAAFDDLTFTALYDSPPPTTEEETTPPPTDRYFNVTTNAFFYNSTGVFRDYKVLDTATVKDGDEYYIPGDGVLYTGGKTYILKRKGWYKSSDEFLEYDSVCVNWYYANGGSDIGFVAEYYELHIPRYKISFDPNGGSGEIAGTLAIKDSQFMLAAYGYDIYTSKFKPPEGYEDDHAYTVSRAYDGAVLCKDDVWRPSEETALSDRAVFGRKETITFGDKWIADSIDKNGNVKSYNPPIDWAGDECDDIFTFHALWRRTTPVYKITCDKNGGTGGTDAFYELYGAGYYSDAECTSSTTKVDVPTWDKHKFLGYIMPANGTWVPITDGNGNIEDEVLNNPSYFTCDTTIYANWAKIITITCDKNGGYGGTDVFYEQYGMGYFSDAACSSAITHISIPSWTHHEFLGYYVNTTDDKGNPYKRYVVDGKGKIWADAGFFTEDTTIYADWGNAVYTITCDKNGGYGGTDEFFEQYSVGYYSNKTCANSITKVDIPTWDGHEFLGYIIPAKDENGDDTWVYITDKNGNIKDYVLNNPCYFGGHTTIYANWKSDGYSVTFHRDGATGNKWADNLSTLTPADAETYPWKVEMFGTMNNSLAYSIKRDHTSFKGWVDEDRNYIYDEHGNASIGKYWDVYGRWIYKGSVDAYPFMFPDVYTITLDKNGGSGGTDYIYEWYSYTFYNTSSCGTAINRVNMPSREGYKFVGYITPLKGEHGEGCWKYVTDSEGRKYLTPANGEHGDDCWQFVIDSEGNILVDGYYFKENTTVYAGWVENDRHAYFIFHKKSDETWAGVFGNIDYWAGMFYDQRVIRQIDPDTIKIEMIAGTSNFNSAMFVTENDTSYYFLGWYTGENGTGEKIFDSGGNAIKSDYWDTDGNSAKFVYNGKPYGEINLYTHRRNKFRLNFHLTGTEVFTDAARNLAYDNGYYANLYAFTTFGSDGELGPDGEKKNLYIETMYGKDWFASGMKGAADTDKLFMGWVTSGNELVYDSTGKGVPGTYWTDSTPPLFNTYNDADLYPLWTYRQNVFVRYQDKNGNYGDYGVGYTSFRFKYEYNSTTDEAWCGGHFVWNASSLGLNTDCYSVNGLSLDYKVTGVKNTYLSVSRKQYPQTVYVRYQKADGTWEDYKKAVDNEPVYYGKEYSFTLGETDTFYSADVDEYVVQGANTSYVDVYRKKYSLSFDTSEGIEWTATAGDYYVGQSVTISAGVSTGYEWTGWTGEGWSDANRKTDNPYTFSMPAHNVTYRPNAARKSFTVTYDYTTNGGTGWNGGTNAKPVTYMDSVPLSYTAYRTGWEHIGWNTDKNATAGLSDYTMPAGDVTLYAIYRKSITVTYKDYYNNSVSTNKTESKYIYNSATSATFTAPSVRNGLSGWTSRGGWSAADGTSADASVSYADGTTVTLSSDAVLYGLYSRTVTLSYNGNGATSTPAAQTGNAYRSASGNIRGYEFTLANAPSFTGYTFEKWHLGSLSGMAYNAGAKYTTYTDDTMYAGKTANTYTVRLYMNKPSNASGTVGRMAPSGWTWSDDEGGYYYRTFTYDARSTLPGAASVYTSLTGWTGGNWNTASNGSGTTYTSGTKAWNLTAVNNGTVKLYATWTANTYTVKLWPNKPSDALSNVSRRNPSGWVWDNIGYYYCVFTYDTSSTLPETASVYTLTEYTGSGWYREAECTNSIEYGTKKWNLTAVNNAVVNLYVKWQDVTGPRITVTPTKTTNSSADNDAVRSVNITVKIEEYGSGLASGNKYQLGFSSSAATAPDTWTTYYAGDSNSTVDVTLSDMGSALNGRYYLWVKEIEDRAGNKSTAQDTFGNPAGYHIFGVYTFDNTAPEGNVTYVENNTTLGLYNDSITSSPYGVMTVYGARDSLSGLKDIYLEIWDAANAGNRTVLAFTENGGTYTCTFDLYNSLSNPQDIEKVRLRILASDKAGNTGSLPITSYDFGVLQTGRPIAADCIGYREVTDDGGPTGIHGSIISSFDEYVYERDAFRVETYIDNISYHSSGTTFMGGHFGQLRIYTFGYVDIISADFGSLREFIKPDYDTEPNLAPTNIPVLNSTHLYTHIFKIPLYCEPAYFTDTIVYGYKNGGFETRNVEYEVSDKIIHHINTILKYNVR